MCRQWRWSSKRRRRGFLTDRSGATAVEFAMVLWPLVLILFGTIEVARVLWTQTALDKTATTAARCIGIRNEHCAREGAFDRDLAISFIQQEARSWGVPLAASTIAVEDAADCDGVPGHSKVGIVVEILSPLPFIAKMMSGSERMQANACFPTQVSS